jgi:hypothetical protein
MKAVRENWKWGVLSGLLVALVAVIGCDWTTGGSGYGSGQANVNFSGTYRGNMSGGRAVERTTGGNIVRLVVSQQGSALEVLDNNGSVYRGRIGSVAVVSVPDRTADSFSDSNVEANTFGAGTQLAQAQVSWSGQDNVAAKEVQFVGTIHAVAVTDIRGNLSQQVNESVETSESIEGDTIVRTTTITSAQGTTVITEVRDRETGQVISRNETSSGTSNAESQFVLTAANTQYRLEGTWVEQGGAVAGVDALSSGAAGAIVVND